MAGALRVYASAIISTLTVTPLAAADLASPAEPLPPPPRFSLCMREFKANFR